MNFSNGSALAIRRKVLGNESQEVGVSLRDVANMLRMEGRQAEAEKTERGVAGNPSGNCRPQGDSEDGCLAFRSVSCSYFAKRADGPKPKSRPASRCPYCTTIFGEEKSRRKSRRGPRVCQLGHILLH